MSTALHLDSEPRAAVSPSALSFENSLDESTLPGRARRIGGILARRAYLPGRQGSCQVTVGWLAERAGCGRSTVRAAIDELQAAGLVEVVYQLDPARGPGGKPHHAPNLYRLHPERLRSVQRPRPARTYLPELGNVSDELQAHPEPPPLGAKPQALAVEDPPPAVGGGSLSPAQDPPSPAGGKETSPRENQEKGEGSPPQRGGEEGPNEAPSQPSRPTAAWLLERYRSAYALHYQRPPVVVAHDRTHAAEVLAAAREQAQHHQQRLSHQGREVQALDDLTEQCVNAWLTRYLARPGRITRDHPGGYLRGQGHPLRWLGGELTQLGTPWDGSRTAGQPPRASQGAAGSEASTVDPSQALTTSVLARVRRRSEAFS
ncbi:MAG: GntR family transcriptional regulator, partial [Myxococcaceae bacterium]